MSSKVALFVPCFVDQLQPQVARDMVAVLRRIGVDVYFPEDQTCCGQPAFNSGQWQEALPVAERFVRIFGSADAVVCPSGSCTAMVRSFYPELLAHSPLRADAEALGKRVFEFSEYLVKIAGVTDVGAEFPHRVTYHDSCHLLRELHLKNEGRMLLRHVKGVEIVEMLRSEECCGFGGVFSVKFGMISAAMGETKAGNVDATKAEFVTSCDSSCLMHIEGILKKSGSPVRTIHLASILARTAAASQHPQGLGKAARS
ncbi:MAG TPA: (Fe-S)-binding protein [Terriglobales bacterium]|nr:(Fe-S)-binding protein [Terriglobales bacterium]